MSMNQKQAPLHFPCRGACFFLVIQPERGRQGKGYKLVEPPVTSRSDFLKDALPRKTTTKISFFNRLDLLYGDSLFHEENPVGNLHQGPVIVGIRIKSINRLVTV